MGFLIRSAFWFSLVLLVIPFPGAESDAPETVGPLEAFFAARAVIDDMSGLCEREPAACEVGANALHTISARARESARLAYEALNETPPAPKAAVASAAPETDALQTGAVAMVTQVSEVVPTPYPAPRD